MFRSICKRAIVWGTVGAIVVRAATTLIVVCLLQIPSLLLAGGVLLIWIAYRLLVPAVEKEHTDAAPHTFWGAMKTIIIADAVMGLDNVLAVSGAAHESFLLVIIGPLVRVPFVVCGSTIILGWIDRFPALIYIGTGALAWTAAKMIVDEPLLEEFINQRRFAVRAIYGAVIGGVLSGGYVVNTRREALRTTPRTQSQR